MRERLIYFFRSKGFIITIIVIVIGLLVGLGFWGSSKIFKKQEEKVYYEVSFLFVDEKGNRVEGVKIKSNGEIIFTTKSDGRYQDKYVEKGTVLTFEIEGYQIVDDGTIKVDKNIYVKQINLISNESQRLKTFSVKIIDINGQPLKNAIVKEGNNWLGTTDSSGIFNIELLEGSKTLSFSMSGNYFSIPNVTVNYEDDPSVIYIVNADFLLEKYLTYTDSEGENHSRTFTVGFDFLTPDGRRLNDVRINYKIQGSSTFTTGKGYHITFENKVFVTAFAYVYDTQNSKWYCSPLLLTSPIGGNVYMQEAICIQAEVDEARSSIYLSNGYYFLADGDKKIQVINPLFDNIKFYKEMEYGYPKYELILVDADMNPVSKIDESIVGVKFILK